MVELERVRRGPRDLELAEQHRPAEWQSAEQQVVHRVGGQVDGERRVDPHRLEARRHRPGPAIDPDVDRGVGQAEVDHHLLRDETVHRCVVGILFAQPEAEHVRASSR